jgi:hypothetical protein
MLFARMKCLAYGHDDRIRLKKQRMYLECTECGRATIGWDLGREPGTTRKDLQSRTAKQPVSEAA